MILATLMLSAAIAAAPPAFDVDYDRFTDTTNIFSSDSLPGRKGDTYFVLAALYRGSKYTPPSSVAYRIQVWAYRDNWNYLRCHSLAILADGKPLQLPRSTVEGDIISGNSVSEYISVLASREDIAAIANARKVEIQVCRDEWLLPTSVSKKAQAIVDATADTSGPVAPPR